MTSREFLNAGYSVARIGSVTIDDHEFRFKSMNELERSEYDFALYSDNKNQDEHTAYLRARSRIIQHCLVDDSDRLEYGEGEESLEEIMRLDSRITKMLADAISDHCGMNENYEDTKKNSNGTYDDSLPTNSQKVSVV